MSSTIQDVARLTSPEAIPISILGLNRRVYNALDRGGVKTFADLQGHIRGLFFAPGSGLGPRALDEIEARLGDVRPTSTSRSSSSDELGWEPTDDRESFELTVPVPQLQEMLRRARDDEQDAATSEQRALQKCLAGEPGWCHDDHTPEETAAWSRRYIDGRLAAVRACDAILARLDESSTAAVA